VAKYYLGIAEAESR